MRVRAPLPKNFGVERNCVNDENQNKELLHTYATHIDVQACHFHAIRDVVAGSLCRPVNLNNKGTVLMSVKKPR